MSQTGTVMKLCDSTGVVATLLPYIGNTGKTILVSLASGIFWKAGYGLEGEGQKYFLHTHVRHSIQS